MPNYSTYKLGEVIEKVAIASKVKQKEYLADGKFPIIDQGQNMIGGYTNDEKLLVNAELPVIVFGDHTKVKKYINFPFVAGADGTKIIKPKKEFFSEPKLFYYFLHCLKFPDKGYARHFQYLLKSDISVPPLATQRAIVTRIESLFAELDKGVEKLKTAQQQLKVYRQAVLNDAYDGNLTIEWRKNNHIDNNTWKEVTFAEIAEIKCNLVDVNDYGDFPHIAPDNIEKESGRLLEYHTVAEDGVISGKHRFFSGQILYSKIRPNLSKVVIADFDGLCSADMYPIEAKENTKFLFYQMLSSKFVDYASNSGSRTVLPKINQKSLSIIPMKVCTLPEQQRIVQEIETRLSACDEVEKNIAESLQQAEALRQSILKKAFSGELV